MLLGAVLALLVATDLFNLYVWFELLLMATLGMLLVRQAKLGTSYRVKVPVG